MRRQTGLFTYADVFSARKEQRERKKENEKKYFTKQEGQPDQICIPDFPVYLDAIESYDRYVHVTYVSSLTFRDLFRGIERVLYAVYNSCCSNEGQVSTDMK